MSQCESRAIAGTYSTRDFWLSSNLLFFFSFFSVWILRIEEIKSRLRQKLSAYFGPYPWPFHKNTQILRLIWISDLNFSGELFSFTACSSMTCNENGVLGLWLNVIAVHYRKKNAGSMNFLFGNFFEKKDQENYSKNYIQVN